MSDYSDDILSLEPLLDRLDQIEARMNPAPDVAAVAVVEQQARDISDLHQELSEIRQKMGAEAAKVQRHFTEMTREVPAMLESLIASHFSGLRDRLDVETKEAIDAALSAFERALEHRMSARMSTLEKALIDQSGIITTLSERALESDANMQRLISAVEKLCERTEGRPLHAAIPQRQPAPRELPFESQLSDAIKRQPESPVEYPDSGFRPKIITQAEAEKQRHRKPMTRI